MHPSTPPSPPALPELSPSDKERIEAWFDNESRLTDVAHAVGTNVLELANWADQPQIAAALDAVERIAKRRTQSLRAEAEHAALSRLLSITRYCEQTEIARRAANAILGLTRSTKRPAHSLKPTDPSLQPAQPQPQPQQRSGPDGADDRDRSSEPLNQAHSPSHAEPLASFHRNLPAPLPPAAAANPISQPQGFG